MPRKGSRRSAAAIDVDVSEAETVEVVEVEQAPEPVAVAPPEQKPAARGVGGEFITRDGKLTQS
jgi:hypothetical protein